MPIDAKSVNTIVESVNYPGVSAYLFTDKRQIEPIKELIKKANTIQFRDCAFVNELMNWVRFNKKELEKHSDGLAYSSLGMPAVPRWLGKLLMTKIITPEIEAKRLDRIIASSSGLMVFTVKGNNAETWVQLGRAYQRVALMLTETGIKHAHLNMPCEVPSVRQELAKLLGFDNEIPLLLLRIGFGKEMPRSPRRELSSMVSI